MPTGYTSAIYDGKQVSFEDYARTCARAFGALIDMRDDPADAPIKIPEETSWYRDSLARDEERLAYLKALTPNQVALEAEKANNETLDYYIKRAAERVALGIRYGRMLAKVKAWEPPSPEHHEFKAFMTEQLESSIKFDCGEIEKPLFYKPDEWLAHELAKAERDVKYSRKALADERQRVANRRKWIEQLLGSLSSDTSAAA